MSPSHIRRTRLVVAAVAASLVGGAALSAVGPAQAAHRTAKPIIIGHRGAAGYRPEHTLGSYELGARMGADYIEPDLVSTKDHVLVARHEPILGVVDPVANPELTTTDVANHPEFADRVRTRSLDGGKPITGWWVNDFTLAELKTLHAKERIPTTRQRNTLYDGRYHIPTFDQIINLVKRLSRELHRPIGIYPETKHPTYFDSLGLSLEEPLVRTLKRNGLNRRSARVFVQSFETSNLKELRGRLGLKTRTVQLFDAKKTQPYDIKAAGGTTTYGDLATPAGLAQVAKYADGVGPSKDYVLNPDLSATSFVHDAHAAGLLVHPYTFRNENRFLLPGAQRPGAKPEEYGFAFKEYAAAFAAGVDGVFSDNADTAVAARGRR